MSLNIRWALVVTSAIVAAILIGESAAAQELTQVAPAAAAVATKSAATPSKKLDLRAPDVTHIYTDAQINRVLAATYNENIEEVEVEGERDITTTPKVWPGLFAPFWALANPAQAWRILMPLPPDQTKGMQNTRVSTTDSYLLEPAGTTRLDY